MTTAIQVLHEHGKENQFKDSQAKLVKVHKINKISISMESCQMKNRYGECTHGLWEKFRCEQFVVSCYHYQNGGTLVVKIIRRALVRELFKD